MVIMVRDIVVYFLDIANDPKGSTVCSSKPSQASSCDIHVSRRFVAYLYIF